MFNSLALTILGLILVLNPTFQASVKYGNNLCPSPGWNPCPPEIPIQPLTQPPQPPQPSYHQPEQSYHPPQPSYNPQPEPSFNPVQPSYNPPQPQPTYNPPPQPEPVYHPPQPQPTYNPPPQPEPVYHPPQPQPTYNPPPQPEPVYHPPQPQPSYQPPANPCGNGYQNPCSPVESHPQPSYPQPQPPSVQNHRDNPLYCYSCNSNQPACQNPYNYTRLDIEHLVPCNGQCIRYQNPNDRYNWYRGCSWEYDFMKPQPPSVHKNGITYYFCETRGCNAIC